MFKKSSERPLREEVNFSFTKSRGQGGSTGSIFGGSRFWAASLALCAVLAQVLGTSDPREGFRHSQNCNSHSIRSSGERAAAQHPRHERSHRAGAAGPLPLLAGQEGGKLAQILKQRQQQHKHNTLRDGWAMKSSLRFRLPLAWVPDA